MRVYAPAAVTVSGLNATGWDANLVVPAAFLITVNHVNETTPGHGVYVGQGAGAIAVWGMVGGVE